LYSARSTGSSAGVRAANGFPRERRAPGALHAQQRDRPRVVVAVVQPVHGLVGEQRAVRIAPSRGQAAGRGDEHPEVGVRGQVHQERRHPVEAGDAVVLLAVQRDEAALDAERRAGLGSLVGGNVQAECSPGRSSGSAGSASSPRRPDRGRAHSESRAHRSTTTRFASDLPSARSR